MIYFLKCFSLPKPHILLQNQHKHMLHRSSKGNSFRVFSFVPGNQLTLSVSLSYALEEQSAKYCIMIHSFCWEEAAEETEGLGILHIPSLQSGQLKKIKCNLLLAIHHEK